MKKLFGVSALVVMLTACSQSAQQGPVSPETIQQQLNHVKQVCVKEVGDPAANIAKFEACFNPKAQQAVNQILAQAERECAAEVGEATQNQEKFDACMEGKGFQVRKSQPQSPADPAVNNNATKKVNKR